MEQPKNMNSLEIDIKDSGTEGGKMWNKDVKIVMQSSDLDMDGLIKRCNTMVASKLTPDGKK